MAGDKGIEEWALISDLIQILCNRLRRGFLTQGQIFIKVQSSFRSFGNKRLDESPR